MPQELGSTSFPRKPTRDDRPETTGVPAPVNVGGHTTEPRKDGPVTSPRARRSADEVPPVWGKVPPPNANFTGRHELLKQLGERLGAGTTAVLPAALHGMGGIGKTQMAVEYIYRHLRDYDIVWWISASRPTQISRSLTELAVRLKVSGAEEAATAVPAALEALRLGQPHRRWLLVFDSAEDPELVRPFFPAGGPGQILVISRNPNWAGIARTLEVAEFQRDESVNLLRRHRKELTREDAGLIAEKLGDLPLAVEQAGTWLAETGMQVGDYLRLFDEKLAEILDTSAPNDYEVSVAAAWNVTFDLLQDRNPGAHQLLQVCAFLAREPISRNLFTGLEGVHIAPELDEILRDPMRLGRAIRDINRCGLAKLDSSGNTLLLHRLVQLVLRNRMSDQHRLQMRHGAHLLLANRGLNAPVSQTAQRYDEILPHIADAELTECTDPRVRELVIDLMEVLYRRGEHEEVLALAGRAVTAWERDREERQARSEELVEDPPLQELRALERWAFFHWAVGRYTEAAEVAERALECHTAALGAAHKETLNAQLTYALILKARGDFSAARRHNEEIHVTARNSFGDDDPFTLRAAHEFTVALLQTGEYAEARELADETYRRRVRASGDDNDDTMGTQVLFVLAGRELGHRTGARSEMEGIAERAQQLYRGDSAGALRRRHFQAVACRMDGSHGEALELSSGALEKFRSRYGDQHPNTMACMLGRSIDLRHNGRDLEARELGEQVLALYRKALGEKHPHTLAAAVDLAVTRRLGGDPAGARAIDRQALEEFRRTLGADHPHAIVCGINLVSDLVTLDRADDATAMGGELLDQARRVLGQDHPTTLAAQLNLSLDLRAGTETVRADELHADVIERYRRTLGPNHPSTVAAAQHVRADCDIDPMPL
jgi:tetratricopeptide (TPR) repeat protein